MNTTLLNLVRFVSILKTPIPTIFDTSAAKPLPYVFSLSNETTSPTLYPSPPSKIIISSTSPFPTVSTIVFCLIVSFDSIRKSLSAYCSETL